MHATSDTKGKRRLYRWFLLLFAGIGLFCLFSTIRTQNYDLKEGDVAPETIYTPRDIVDEEATKEQKERAREAVSPIYSADATAYSVVAGEIDLLVGEWDRIRGEAKSYAIQNGYEGTEALSTVLTDLQIDRLRTQLSLPMEQVPFLSLLDLSAGQQSGMVTAVKNILSRRMETGIRAEDLEAAKEAMRLEAEQGEGARPIRELVFFLIDRFAVSNMVMDQDATDAAMQAAEDTVLPVEIRQGQAIVRQGEILSKRQIAVLSALGLTADSFNYHPYAALALALLAGAAGYYGVARIYEPRLLRLNRASLLIGVVLLLTFVLASFLVRVDMHYVSVVMIPICITMAYSVKAGASLGCLCSVLMAILGYCAEVDGKIVLAFLVANLTVSSLCAMLVGRMRSRNGILMASLLSGIGAALAYFLVGLANSEGVRSLLLPVGYGFLGTFATGVVSLGAMPIWENLFGIITPMKLMELCNPSSPLLKRLTMEAPGTYHHSVMVANLAEAAAEAIGADSLLAWAGAYYHDVGKLMAPQYYGENLMGHANPHDGLTPEESCAIITRHPHDGAKILKEYQMPESFREIALSHHGDSLLVFFANRAKELYGAHANMMNYRHTGRKPETKEEGIVMLADAVEAATRSNPKDLEKKIRDVIQGKLGEGQLAFTPLTFVDIKKISVAFEGVLQGVHHKRVEYPDVDATELMGMVREGNAVGEGEGERR